MTGVQSSIMDLGSSDENPDIREEARAVAGEAWITEPNRRLGGRSPEEAIRAGEERLVRDILRSIKHIGVS